MPIKEEKNLSHRIRGYTKNILLYMVLIILPTLIIAQFFYFLSRDISDMNIQKMHGNTFNSIAEDMDAKLNGLDESVAFIYQNDYYKSLNTNILSLTKEKLASNYDANKLVSNLNQLCYTTQDIRLIAIYSKKSNVIIHNYGIQDITEFINTIFNEKIKDFDEFLSQSKNWNYSFYYGNLQTINIKYKMYKTIPVVKILTMNGEKVEDAIVFFVDPLYFTRIFDTNTINTHLFITDSIGNVMAGTPANGFQMNPQKNVQTTKLGSLEYYIYTYKLNHFEWILWMYIPKNLSIENNWVFFTEFIAVVLLLGILLAILLSFGSYRYVDKVVKSIIDFLPQNMLPECTPYSFHFISRASDIINEYSKNQKMKYDELYLQIKNQIHSDLFTGVIRIDSIKDPELYKELSSCNILCLSVFSTISPLPGNQYDTLLEFSNYLYENYKNISMKMETWIANNNSPYLIALFYSDNENISVELFYDSLHEFINKCLLQYKASNCILLSGLGEPVQSWEDVPKSFDEAKKSLLYKCRNEQKLLLQYREMKDYNDENSYFSLKDEVELISFVKSGRFKPAIELLSQIDTENTFRKHLTSTAAGLLYSKIVCTFEKCGIISDHNYFEILIDPNGINSLSNLMKVGKRFLSQMALSHDQDSSRTHTILKTLEFVENNFLNPQMSLGYIEKKLDIGSRKLSKIFSDDLLCSFNQFFSLKRIEYAKNLLINCNMSIYEVSEKSGFSDVNVFIRTFKSYEGITPQKYSNNM